MNKLSTWLLVLFMVMFWGFRIIISFTNALGINMEINIPDTNFEVILLFVTLLSIILVVKRKILGALLYVITYELYFGTAVYNNIINIVTNKMEIDLNVYMNFVVLSIAIILPILILFDLLLDKNRKAHPKDKKTDWFYNNKEFDRKLDERADKNNYRTL